MRGGSVWIWLVTSARQTEERIFMVFTDSGWRRDWAQSGLHWTFIPRTAPSDPHTLHSSTPTLHLQHHLESVIITSNIQSHCRQLQLDVSTRTTKNITYWKLSSFFSNIISSFLGQRSQIEYFYHFIIFYQASCLFPSRKQYIVGLKFGDYRNSQLNICTDPT